MVSEPFLWTRIAPARISRIPGVLLPLILLLLAISLPGHARSSADVSLPPSPSVYDPASFIEELGRLKAALPGARKSSRTLREFRDAIPDAWTVQSGEKRYKVSTFPLRSRLDKAEYEPALRQQQLNQARDYLDALAAETSSLSGLPPVDASSARVALDRILSRPEYAHNRQPTWWDRFRAFINAWIATLLERLFRSIGGQRSLGVALLWLGICAAALLLAYSIFRRWFRAARMEEMALQSAAIAARSWQQWIFASRAAAARQDYRLAIHCAYWAGVARLEELGAVSSDRAKTPRETLRSLMKFRLVLPETYAARYQALAAMTSRLENIWYGYHTATETDFRDTLNQLEILGCHLP